MKTTFYLWQTLELAGGGKKTRFLGAFASRAKADAAQFGTSIPAGLDAIRADFDVVEVEVGRNSRETGLSFADIISWVPLAAFVTLMTFPVIAMMRTGHLPHYSHPDPKDLHLPWLYLAAMCAIPIGFFGACLGALWLVLEFKTWNRWHIAVFVAGTLFWYFSAGIVGGLIDWLLD